MKSVFQKIYDLKINFSVSSFWCGGFDVKIGDEMNSWKAEGHVRDWNDVAPWLVNKVLELWSDNEFVQATLRSRDAGDA